MSGFKGGFIIGEETRPKIEIFNQEDVKKLTNQYFIRNTKMR